MKFSIIVCMIIILITGLFGMIIPIFLIQSPNWVRIAFPIVMLVATCFMEIGIYLIIKGSK